jgi:hypothetical protein
MVRTRSFAGSRSRVAAAVLGGLLAVFATETRGIEMFTFFGDGSRIGLPSLEVPIEAYPGIPLRSDRIRARRRAMRQPPQQRTGQLPAGVTIRAMPAPQPAAMPRNTPNAPRAAPIRGRTAPAHAEQPVPVAPLPEDVFVPRGQAD